MNVRDAFHEILHSQVRRSSSSGRCVGAPRHCGCCMWRYGLLSARPMTGPGRPSPRRTRMSIKVQNAPIPAVVGWHTTSQGGQGYWNGVAWTVTLPADAEHSTSEHATAKGRVREAVRAQVGLGATVLPAHARARPRRVAPGIACLTCSSDGSADPCHERRVDSHHPPVLRAGDRRGHRAHGGTASSHGRVRDQRPSRPRDDGRTGTAPALVAPLTPPAQARPLPGCRGGPDVVPRP